MSSFHRRIKKDIELLHKEPVEGIFVVADEDKLDILHALIVGPKDTPYEGGFFYFVVRFPDQYPMKPPNVKLMTTGNGSVRFNPNLYSNGKVCVSILGTWSGPGWQPIMSLRSVLLSIQTLLNEEPAFNEPGINRSSLVHAANSKKYNEYLIHETLRVAVLDMVQDKNGDSKSMPIALRQKIKKHFVDNYAFYEGLAKSRSGKEPEKRSWFCSSSSADGGMFGLRYDCNYRTLRKRLEAARVQVTQELANLP